MFLPHVKVRKIVGILRALIVFFLFFYFSMPDLSLTVRMQTYGKLNSKNSFSYFEQAFFFT